MIRLFKEGEGGAFHQAFVADAGLLVALHEGLAQLRCKLDVTSTASFFNERTRSHEDRLHDATADISDADAELWEERIAAVLPTFGGWTDRIDLGHSSNMLSLRLLGWLKVQAVVGRLEALGKLSAPAVIVEGQRRELRAALDVAAGRATVVRDDPDFGFWRDAKYLQLAPHDRELIVTGHAQEIVDRSVELCIEPLAAPCGLGADVRVALEGTPLLGAEAPAKHWREPLTKPYFLVGRDAAAATSIEIVGGKNATSDLSSRIECFRQAALCAMGEGAALIWWWEVDA